MAQNLLNQRTGLQGSNLLILRRLVGLILLVFGVYLAPVGAIMADVVSPLFLVITLVAVVLLVKGFTMMMGSGKGKTRTRVRRPVCDNPAPHRERRDPFQNARDPGPAEREHFHFGYCRERSQQQLDTLLAAGIITKEEYRQRQKNLEG